MFKKKSMKQLSLSFMGHYKTIKKMLESKNNHMLIH